ncbi:MAG: phage tail protein [Pseudomonadota bacterium]
MDRITIDSQQIDRIDDLLDQLSEAEIQRAMVRGINATLRNLVTRLTKKLREKLNIKSSEIKKRFKTIRASKRLLFAQVDFSGLDIPLHDFKSKQRYKGKTKSGKRKRAGVAVKIYRGRSAEVFRHMFHLKNEMNRPIFQRVKDAARLPIEYKYGPSVADVIRFDDPELAETRAFTQERLMFNIRQEMESTIFQREQRRAA